MERLLNPALPVHPARAADWQGNLFADGSFQYEREPVRVNFGSVVRMLTTSNPQSAAKRADRWAPPVDQDVTYLTDRSRNWIVWLGHACFLMQLNGKRFLTDPQLRDLPTIPRRVHPPFSYADIRGVDYLLLSHDHRDHVDEKCIRTLCANNNIKKILAPLRLSRLIGKWVGDTPIEEAAWYQRYDTGDSGVAIHFLPARHWCRRGLTDFNHHLWGSFMLEVKEGEETRTIYYGADSGTTSYWAEIAKLFPDIDVALLGIGAYRPSYMMETMHTTPAEAFAAYRTLGARYWWPMHHGTYDLSQEPASEPVLWASRLMEESGEGNRLIPAVVNRPWWMG